MIFIAVPFGMYPLSAPIFYHGSETQKSKEHSVQSSTAFWFGIDFTMPKPFGENCPRNHAHSKTLSPECAEAETDTDEYGRSEISLYTAKNRKNSRRRLRSFHKQTLYNRPQQNWQNTNCTQGWELTGRQMPCDSSSLVEWGHLFGQLGTQGRQTNQATNISKTSKNDFGRIYRHLYDTFWVNQCTTSILLS